MLIPPESVLFTYPITRDYGFAPNPFHGYCTLATCKPHIRKKAKIGDWIMGVAGANLKKIKHQCIFLMKVSEKLTFEEYWNDGRFLIKRPSRNGSLVKMLGDNIYHRDKGGSWIQEDSHHSNKDGSINQTNLLRDTGSCENVLISNFFFYFGENARPVDLGSIGYTRIRDFKKTPLDSCVAGRKIIHSLVEANFHSINILDGDPNQFLSSHHRVDQGTSKIL